MQNPLVAGGAGFLGSHFCDRPVARGIDELCADSFYSSSKANIAHVLGKTPPAKMRHHTCWSLCFEVERIFYTSGLGMHPQDRRVAPDFFARARRGEDLTSYRKGMPTRSFCNIHDLADTMLQPMDSPADFTAPIAAEMGAEGQPGRRAKGNYWLISRDLLSRAWPSKHTHNVSAFKPQG